MYGIGERAPTPLPRRQARRRYDLTILNGGWASRYGSVRVIARGFGMVQKMARPPLNAFPEQSDGIQPQRQEPHGWSDRNYFRFPRICRDVARLGPSIGEQWPPRGAYQRNPCFSWGRDVSATRSIISGKVVFGREVRELLQLFTKTGRAAAFQQGGGGGGGGRGEKLEKLANFPAEDHLAGNYRSRCRNMSTPRITGISFVRTARRPLRPGRRPEARNVATNPWETKIVSVRPAMWLLPSRLGCRPIVPGIISRVASPFFEPLRNRAQLRAHSQTAMNTAIQNREIVAPPRLAAG